MPNQKILGDIARIFTIAAAVVALPAHPVQAFNDNQSRVLPLPTQTVSATPSNGDVNPYGVAFVPENFPTGGKLNPGDLLVSNFNDFNNIQGTGTTIINISSSSQASVFFQGTAPLGLSTGLAVLKAGFVLVANCPTNGQTPVAGAAPGSLLGGGAFGLKATKVINNVFRFAAVDDNANTITIWTLNGGN